MELAHVTGWEYGIDRGPDWLFVRLIPRRGGDTGEFPLAEEICDLLAQQFLHRVVVEMDAVPILRSWLVGQLVHLHKRVVADGGMMRLCGLSPHNHEVLRLARIADRFPQYQSRTDAVMGRRPAQPR